jgi:hypothetical protein
MLGVSYFSETLLKAVEDELTVRVSFTYLETELNLSPSHSTGASS